MVPSDSKAAVKAWLTSVRDDPPLALLERLDRSDADADPQTLIAAVIDGLLAELEAEPSQSA
jgi:hypothetical protein